MHAAVVSADIIPTVTTGSRIRKSLKDSHISLFIKLLAALVFFLTSEIFSQVNEIFHTPQI